MIRTAITGSEKFIRNYVDIIGSTPGFLVTGIHSNDHVIILNQNSSTGCNEPATQEQLVEISDALIVAGKSGDYFEIISRFLKSTRHVLILPDTSLSHQQLKKLTKIAEEAGVILNLHHNTLNANIKKKICEFIYRPEYIFLKSQISENSEVYQTIFEALFRYIYLILELNPVNIVKYQVTGIPVCSPQPRILDVAIHFENGTSAHLNISTYVKEESEKLEIFAQDRMISCEPLRSKLLMIMSKTDSVKRNSIKDPFWQKDEKDVLQKFFLAVTNKNGSESRFDSGVISHQIASGILHQIHPLPVEN
ncbi:MAG: hypothetical protein R6X15_06940 [Pseudomonadota bacterium]